MGRPSGEGKPQRPGGADGPCGFCNGQGQICLSSAVTNHFPAVSSGIQLGAVAGSRGTALPHPSDSAKHPCSRDTLSEGKQVIATRSFNSQYFKTQKSCFFFFKPNNPFRDLLGQTPYPDWASLMAQPVKNLPVVWETCRSLGREDPLKKTIATYSSILAYRIQ